MNKNNDFKKNLNAFWLAFGKDILEIGVYSALVASFVYYAHNKIYKDRQSVSKAKVENYQR